MKWIVQKPNLYDDKTLATLVGIINEGNEVVTNIDRLKTADVIAVGYDGNKIVCTGTLKNPNKGYKKDVFSSAGKPDEGDQYNKELGYIVTNSEYEGQKLCQQMIDQLKPHFEGNNVFATTRKPKMAHILGKYDFVKTGKEYKTYLSLYCLNNDQNT